VLRFLEAPGQGLAGLELPQICEAGLFQGLGAATSSQRFPGTRLPAYSAACARA
jgi:hypothetical protein